jgi:hypothetical protein
MHCVILALCHFQVIVIILWLWNMKVALYSYGDGVEDMLAVILLYQKYEIY